MAELAAGKMIGTDPELTHFDRSLMWVLTSYLQYGNALKLSQADVAREMKTSPEQISRSMARLVERGYVEKGENRTYKLSEYVGYRGSRTKRVANLAAKKGMTVVQGEKSE